MIALLLLAIITTTSVSMLFLNIKGWESVSESSDRQIAEHLALARVENMIQHLLPISWREQQMRLLAFSGDAGHIQFIAPAPQQYQAGGLFEYRLADEFDSEQGHSLVLYYAPYYPDAKRFSIPEQGRRRILVPGLESVRFHYYGRKYERAEPEWTDLWERTSRRYPELVRISTVPGGGNTSPEERFVRILQQALE